MDTQTQHPQHHLARHQQGARIGQIVTIALAILLHQLLIWGAWLLGVVSFQPEQMGMLTIGCALLVLVLVTVVLLEWNLRAEDPDLSLVQMSLSMVVMIASLHLVADQKAVVGLSGLMLVLAGANRLNQREWITFVAIGLLLLGSSAALDYLEGLTVDVTAYGALMIMLLAATLIYRREMTQIEVNLMERNASLSQTVRRIEALATTDTLTGLANRRRLQEVLTYNKAMADRQTGYSFALCYMDLDFFKQVNDRFGHSAGDRVLQEVARLAQSVVRSVDCVARVGGEEFILVLTHSTEEDAQHVAERLALGLRDIEVSPMDSSYRVTASIGITRYLSPESVEDTVERADKSLYDAKRSGRNRIVQADLTQPDPRHVSLQRLGSTGRFERET